MDEYNKNFWFYKLEQLSRIHGACKLHSIKVEEIEIKHGKNKGKIKEYKTFRYIFADGYTFSYDTEID